MGTMLTELPGQGTAASGGAEAEDAGSSGYFLSPRVSLEPAVALLGLLGPCHRPRTSEILHRLALMVSLLGGILPSIVTKFSPSRSFLIQVRHSIAVL